MRDWQGAMIRQWWNMSSAARKGVLANKKTGIFAGKLIERWLNYTWDTNDFRHFIWIRNVDLAYNSGIVTVGWRGCFTDSAREYISSLL
jgi:hypothetical protein